MCGCFNNSSRNINTDNDLYSLSINQNSNCGCGCNTTQRGLKDVLTNNIGNRCTADFQNGNNVVRRTGIFLVIWQK